MIQTPDEAEVRGMISTKRRIMKLGKGMAGLNPLPMHERVLIIKLSCRESQLPEQEINAYIQAEQQKRIKELQEHYGIFTDDSILWVQIIPQSNGIAQNNNNSFFENWSEVIRSGRKCDETACQERAVWYLTEGGNLINHRSCALYLRVHRCWLKNILRITIYKRHFIAGRAVVEIFAIKIPINILLNKKPQIKKSHDIPILPCGIFFLHPRRWRAKIGVKKNRNNPVPSHHVILK